MAEKQIQLHKKNDVSEKWYPITRGSDVKLLDYSKTSDEGDIQVGDTLNKALSKLENKTSGGGGSGTVDTGSTNQLAIYTGTNKVAGCANVTFSSNTLNVTGSVVVTGNVTCSVNSSDKRLKTDIEPFKGLDIIENLNFVKFKWNDTACGLNGYYKSDDVNYGVIAQDSEGVIDGFVFDMAGGYKGVRYEKLIPIMAQAIKELQNKINILEQKLK